MSVELQRETSTDAESVRSPISLATGEIHLWLAYYDQINDEELHRSYRRMLNEAERQQEPRFYFARDRRRYLVTRALVRTVLSRYAPVQPEDWTFATNAWGRPEICNSNVVDHHLSFNISHTHSLIVLGVTRLRALGVDVENIQAREASIGVANHFFASTEVSALAELPSQEQHYRFFECWTFKESYIKARGMGLSLPLDKFGFHFPSARAVELDIHEELADTADRWQFWQFQPTPEYLIAVCAERMGNAPAHLIVRQVVPLHAEMVLATTLLRASHQLQL